MRHDLGGLLLQEGDALADRPTGERHALQHGGVQLLEGGEPVGLHRLRDFGEGRERHHLPVRRAHAVAQNLVNRRTLGARHLRDHLVAAAIDGEAVDIVAAQERGQRGADVTHGDAQPVGAVLVDHQLHLRRLEAQVGVGEDEEARLVGFRLQLVEGVGQSRVVTRIGEHELDRQVACTHRNGRRSSGEDVDARHRLELRLQFTHHRQVRTLALVPRLQDQAHEGLVGVGETVDGEEVLALRDRHEGLGQVVGVSRQIVEVGVLGRIDEGEEHALVLGRRQLAADGIVKDAR